MDSLDSRVKSCERNIEILKDMLHTLCKAINRRSEVSVEVASANAKQAEGQEG